MPLTESTVEAGTNHGWSRMDTDSVAPNNTGKTNVIRALKFIFYGHLPS
jgi:hypothetical protein